MAGIRACVYIAVDRFGAETLGRFQALLRDVDNREMLERCRFHWAGLDPRPEPTSYWTDDTPVWTEAEPADEPFQWDVETDPTLIPDPDDPHVDAVLLDHVESVVAGGEALRRLVDGDLTAAYGSAELDEVVLILVGAPTNPGTPAILRGFLAGTARCRATGSIAQSPSEYLILGVGHHTCDDASSELARSRSGLALLDLEDYFVESPDLDADAVAYVINEQVDPSEGAVLDRRSQVELAGALAVGLAAEAGRPLTPGEFRPLRFRRMPLAQRSEWGAADHVLTGGVKFAYCGGAALHFPTTALDRILATHLLEGACLAFAEADPDSVMADADEPEVDNGLVNDLTDATAERLARELHSLDLAPDPSPPVWTLAGAEGVSDRVYNRTWDEARAAFGDRLFKRLPLEDWEQTLDDMQEFVTTGLVSRLESDRAGLSRHLVHAFDQGLEAGFSLATARALGVETGFAPRRHCLASLSGIRTELEQAIAEGQEAWRLAERHDERELDVFKRRISDARKRIVDLMNGIPSPQALMLRAMGLFSSFVVLGLVLPFGLGVLDTWFGRAGLGVLVASLVLGWSWQRIRSAKARLMAALEEWVEAQRRYYEVRQAEARHETVQMILAELKRYADWLLVDEDDAPGAFVLEEAEPWRPGEAPDYPRHRRRFLHGFSADMTAASDAWRTLRGELISTMRDAKNVLYFPRIERGALRFDRLPVPPPAIYLDPPSADAIRGEFARVRSVQESDGSPCWLLDGRADVQSTWTLDALLPSGEDLLDEAVRSESPAFGLLDAVSDQVAEAWGTSLERIVERMLSDDWSQGEVSLPVRHMNAEMSSIEFLQSAHRVSIATSEKDPLIEVMNSGQAIVLGPEYHCNLSISMPLTGRDIAFAGDEDTPRTYLAKATKAALDGESS